jgi:D-glycero-alpha-D-manno-heptose-7-phosphate kinase
MTIRARAPLRLSLAGGGTDLSPYCDRYGGCVLNATIDLYAYCTIEPWDKPEIVFQASDRQEIYTSEITDYLEFNGTLDLHKGVYNRIVKQYNSGKPLAFKMTTYSDAPAGSGLGSSSTLVVAMLQAYVEWLKLPLGEYDVAHLAYEIERMDVGLSGGKQDQYASTFGGFNFIEFYDQNRVIVNPLRVKDWIVNELESSLVLYYTGTSRASANVVDEQISNIQQSNQQATESTHEIKKYSYAFKEDLLKGNILDLARDMHAYWEAKKKTAQGITNSIIERAYEVALESGAYSGKVSGAGGGGFLMFLVNPTRREDVVARLRGLEGRVMTCHFTTRGAEGWRVKSQNLSLKS